MPSAGQPKHPRSFEAHANFEAGRQALQNSDPRAAAEHFRQTLRAEPTASLAHFYLGSALLEAGDLTGAAISLLRCATAHPRHLESNHHLAWALERTGDLQGALIAYRKCLKHHPDHLDTAFRLAGCLRLSGEVDAGLTLYRDWLADYPDRLVAAYNFACMLQRAGDVAGATAVYRACLAVNPDHQPSAYNLACLLQAAGDDEGAIAAYRDCYERHPETPDSAENLARLMLLTGRHVEAAEILHELCERFPANTEFTDNLAIAKWRSRIAQARDSERGRKFTRILVACMPKSGSTFVAEALANLPSMRRVHLVPEYGRREQEPWLELLLNHHGCNYVSQLHLRPSAIMLDVLAALSVRPVVLVRNIWDVMVSLRDHMYSTSLDWSMAQVDPRFHDWDEERQYLFLAHTMMPWFVDFHVGWSRVAQKLSLTYERLIANPGDAIASVVRWADHDVDDREISDAIARTGNAKTFNKGGSGRGRAVPPAARAHVEQLLSYYPDVDFVPLIDSPRANEG